jgi:hypothetical protein
MRLVLGAAGEERRRDAMALVIGTGLFVFISLAGIWQRTATNSPSPMAFSGRGPMAFSVGDPYDSTPITLSVAARQPPPVGAPAHR